MNITVFRTNSNRLYTEGYLSINDLKTTYTVENTSTMLPDGKYEVRLHGGSQRRRIIAIMALPHSVKPSVPYTLGRFEACGTWISSKKNKSICLGEPIIPGALKKGTDHYERLFDRIEKAEKRGEKTYLDIVTGSDLKYGEPIQYWLEPATHGCPPSKVHVEKDEDGNVSIYNGDELLKFIPAEEEEALEATATIN